MIKPRGAGRVVHIKVIAVAVLTVVVLCFTPGAVSRTGGSSAHYIFSGRGRAHGVGVCMDGVYYRAKSGQGYQEMLNYYYTGIEFSKTDESRPIRVRCSDGVIRAYPLNEYLYRLAEEPETFPSEGLKTVMVAARTYVLSVIARGKHTGGDFDICASGGCCQAFNHNLDPNERPNNKRAVDETAGIILTHGGKVITAAYCGSCGGHTENNEDVWGSTPIPYLRGKPDEWCKYSSRYSWTVSMSAQEVENRLNAHADSQVGNLRAIDLSERTPGGRIKRARLVGSEGTKYIRGSSFYGRLGLSSSLVEILPDNFDEYLLVCNIADEPARVTFTFMQPSGETSSEEIEVSGHSRYTLSVDDYLQFHETSVAVSSDKPIITERAMYFDYHGKQGGHSSAGVLQPATSWYLPEGCTAGGFDTYVLVQNPDVRPARIKFTFMTQDGENVVKELELVGRSRLTVGVDEEPGLAEESLSTLVESENGVPIIVERAVYFDWNGRTGGHVSPGATTTRDSWYFAEGYTGGEFDTFFLVQNPTDEEISLVAEFLRSDGTLVEKEFQVDARSRFTIWSDQIKGLEDAEFSTRLTSEGETPFAAERTMYFAYGGIKGGHDCIGVEGPSPRWYLAEGYTGGDFDTYVLLANFSETAAPVTVTFMKPSGETVTRDYQVGPQSRHTIIVDWIPELEQAEFSVKVDCDAGSEVVVERAEYFNYRGRGGGHASPGVIAPAMGWHFAEGYTGN